MDTTQLILGAVVGIVTAIVSYRAFRDFSTFGGASLPLALCGGIVAAIGVMNLGDRLVVFTIPWAALGIAVCLLLILGFIARLFHPAGASGTEEDTKPPKSLGKSSKSSSDSDKYRIGTLLPPTKGETNHED